MRFGESVIKPKARQAAMNGRSPAVPAILLRAFAVVARVILTLAGGRWCVSACSGKVGTGFPNRTCAKSKNLERITIRPNRDAL
jgi:hypothetical protein